MTCIVGVEDENGVHIGADSFWGSSYSVDRIGQAKVVTVDYSTPDGVEYPIMVGLSGSPRVLQLIDYTLELDEDPRSHRCDHAFLVTHVADKLRGALKDGGALESNDGIEETNGWCLIGWRGRLYFMGAGFQVTSSQRGYKSVGSGQYWADGSLATTEDMGWEPQERLRAALKAASEHCTTVTGPYNFYEQPKPDGAP